MLFRSRSKAPSVFRKDLGWGSEAEGRTDGNVEKSQSGGSNGQQCPCLALLIILVVWKSSLIEIFWRKAGHQQQEGDGVLLNEGFSVHQCTCMMYPYVFIHMGRQSVLFTEISIHRMEYIRSGHFISYIDTTGLNFWLTARHWSLTFFSQTLEIPRVH